MTIIHGFTSFNTITAAPRIALSLTVMPGLTKASAQMHASVPIALLAPLQRLAKAGGRWQFKRLTWKEIELPNYRLPKIT